MEALTFEKIPEAIVEINNKIEKLLSLQLKQEQEPDKLMTLDELIDFLPEHPARQTVYGWINNRLVPHEKYGKRLYFRRSKIKEWLDNGRKLTE